MQNLKRADVDVPALRLFENWVLDVESTRTAFAAQIDAQAALARQEADRAATEAATARAMLTRIDRDYESGELGPVAYERQLSKQTEMLAAAEAEHARPSAHADEVEARGGGIDPESEVFHRLAQLRAKVAGDVSDRKGDVDGLRAALTACFEAVYVVPYDSLYCREDGAHDELHVRLGRDCDRPRDDDAAVVLEATPDGPREQRSEALAIVPVIRKSMLADPDALIFPKPIRPLALSLSENQLDRHPGAAPNGYEHPVQAKDQRPTHPAEAIGGQPGLPCHTNPGCMASPRASRWRLLGYALVGEGE
jgi:hypothetical protein